MSRIPILLLALTTVVAPAQYGSSRDQSTQQSAQTTTGRPIPNRTVPKPPNASSGSSDQPTIKVNPLSALAPGFLRGLFNLFPRGETESDPSALPPNLRKPGRSDQ